MPRTSGRGRRPAAAQPADPGVSDVSREYERMFPGDRTTVQCRMPACGQWVPDVAAHLRKDHGKTELADYLAEFPGAAVKGEEHAEAETDTRLTVTAKEAREHPGGRDGALMEKTLPRTDRRGFREALGVLIASGYPAGYRLAALAYRQVLVARCRLDIEEKRLRSNGVVLPGEAFELMDKLEARIAGEYRDLEKERMTRASGVDPMEVIQSTIGQAEAYLRENQGEHVVGCPHCNLPLHPPDLPYWCFAPMQTRHGLEWVVWSTELWILVRAGQIRLWQMAFALRTSPEGLQIIAGRRGEEWPAEIDLAAEEALLRVELDRLDLEEMYQLRPREVVAEVERATPAGDAAPDEPVEAVVEEPGPADPSLPGDRL